MEELHKFVFGTIVCDGCGCRFDSKFDDERLHDLDELLDDELKQHEWEEQSEGKWYCPECTKDPAHRTQSGEGRIIVERMALSGLRCDHCGAIFENSEGYHCWKDSSYTEEIAREEEWEIDEKNLCPDCWRTCDAMEDSALDDDDWKEKYCPKCPNKDNCNEIVAREVPDVSLECKTAKRKHYELAGVKYEQCPYYAPNKVMGLRGKCYLPKGQKCPRVEAWEIDREKVKRNNEEIREWVKNGDSKSSTP